VDRRGDVRDVPHVRRADAQGGIGLGEGDALGGQVLAEAAGQRLVVAQVAVSLEGGELEAGAGGRGGGLGAARERRDHRLEDGRGGEALLVAQLRVGVEVARHLGELAGHGVHRGEDPLLMIVASP
jgi:hypothetical protein